MSNGIVIVGGGLAAARVAKAFRGAGGTGSVTMLSDDVNLPYNRPPLSKGFLRGEMEADGVFVEPEAAYGGPMHVVPVPICAICVICGFSFSS